MKNSCVLRTFHASDLEAILQLFHDVVHSVGLKYYDQEQVNAWAPPLSGLDKSRWLQSLSENITYVVTVDDRIVGFGDITDTGYLNRLFVDKKYQGKGVALAILKKLEDEARRLGLQKITTEASIMAMPLAKLQGFEIVAQQHKMHGGKEFLNFLMRKIL